jgi:endonuclease/exonuclease/phosphatase family metal-dependent hydrolase
MRLKILQWNIWYQEKIENILKILKNADADIVCLQELTINGLWNNYKDTTKFISKKLRLYSKFAPVQTFPEGNTSGIGILSKFPIKGVKIYPIQDEVMVQNFKYEKRACLSTKIQIDGKTKLKVATAQLSYTPRLKITKQKEKEIRKLLDFIKKQKENFLIAGDFNATPNSYILNKIKKYLKNCGPSYKEPTWTTKPFNKQGFKANKLKWRLDYLFSTRDINIISSKIIKTNFSDHLPIIVEIEV